MTDILRNALILLDELETRAVESGDLLNEVSALQNDLKELLQNDSCTELDLSDVANELIEKLRAKGFTQADGMISDADERAAKLDELENERLRHYTENANRSTRKM